MKTDSELSDFIISPPYVLSGQDNADILKASRGHPRKENWESK